MRLQRERRGNYFWFVFIVVAILLFVIPSAHHLAWGSVEALCGLLWIALLIYWLGGCARDRLVANRLAREAGPGDMGRLLDAYAAEKGRNRRLRAALAALLAGQISGPDRQLSTEEKAALEWSLFHLRDRLRGRGRAGDEAMCRGLLDLAANTADHALLTHVEATAKEARTEQTRCHADAAARQLRGEWVREIRAGNLLRASRPPDAELLRPGASGAEAERELLKPSE